MKVDFDWLRKNATRSMESLFQEIKYVIEEYQLDDNAVEDLKDKFDYASRMVMTFNCLYDPEDENFNNLSELNISMFDDKE